MSPPDAERLEEMRDRLAFYKPAADRVNTAACKLGQGFTRKAFIADVARDVGLKPNKHFGSLLTLWDRLGWVELQRADMRVGLDPQVVTDSEVVVREPGGAVRASYHFVVCPRGR